MDVNKKALSYFNSFYDSFNKRRGDSWETFATNRTVSGCSCCVQEGKAAKGKDRNTNTCALGAGLPCALPDSVRRCLTWAPHVLFHMLSAPARRTRGHRHLLNPATFSEAQSKVPRFSKSNAGPLATSESQVNNEHTFQCMSHVFFVCLTFRCK